jgi:hypothetical protein
MANGGRIICSNIVQRPESITELMMSVSEMDFICYVIFNLTEVRIVSEVLNSDRTNAISGKSYRPLQGYITGNCRIYQL